ncbi:MAG: T9SS type A sorting domain-containing protein [Candidatus Kapabacteria bacterium]|nr:T9SS type A sorting domain-containing protein [Candidatus Kapabacteria bacterium]
MKKFFVFVAFVICNFSLFAQVDEPTPNQKEDLPDTVWTKNIWPEEVVGVMFSQDGSQVYVSTMYIGSINGVETIYNRVWIINSLTGDSIRTISGVGGFKVMSSDNKFIYTSKYKKLDATTFQILDSLKNLKYIGYQYHDLTLTADNKFILSVGAPGNSFNNPNYSLMKINTETMEVDEYIDYPGAMNHVAASSDGKYFVTDWENGIFMSKDKTKKLLLWDENTFKVVKEIETDTLNISSIKFSSDNSYLCSAFGGQVRIFDTKDFKKIKIIPKLSGALKQICISEDVKYIILGGGTIRVFNIDAEKLIYTFTKSDILPDGGNALEMDKNKKYIAGATAWLLTLYNFNNALTEVKDISNLTNTITISPNPINGNSLITLKNSTPNYFNISIFDNTGKLINNLFSGNLEVGEHIYYWNTQLIPNGVYVCKVTGKNVNLSTKIIVSK